MSDQRILGSIIGLDLSTISTDTSMSITSSGNWLATACFLTNVNGTGHVAPSIVLRDGAGGTGNQIAGGGSFSTIASADDAQKLGVQHPLDDSGGGAMAKVYHASTLYARFGSTAWPAGTTGDLYLVGIDL